MQIGLTYRLPPTDSRASGAAGYWEEEPSYCTHNLHYFKLESTSDIEEDQGWRPSPNREGNRKQQQQQQQGATQVTAEDACKEQWPWQQRRRTWSWVATLASCEKLMQGTKVGACSGGAAYFGAAGGRGREGEGVGAVRW